MKTNEIEYLKKYFPGIYSKNTVIECDSGRFRLLVWLGRYINSYIVAQNNLSKQDDRYLPVTDFKLIEISDNTGIISVNYIGGDEAIAQAISVFEYISAYMCSICGAQLDVYFVKGKTICKRCIDKNNIDITNIENKDNYILKIDNLDFDSIINSNNNNN